MKPACVLLIVFFFTTELYASQTVRISILSKTLRLMKEGKTGEIAVDLPDGCAVYDLKTKKSFSSKRITIRWKNGWILEAGAALVDFDIRITSPANLPAAIKISGEKRLYPLPMRIMLKTDPVIITEDEIYQYSGDSSFAELSPLGASQYEAFAALTHVVLARTKQKTAHRSGEYDFCDLTTDQIYKGRMTPREWSIRDDSWIIDTAKLKGELLFHANSGGETYGSEVFGSKGGYPGVHDNLYRMGISLGHDQSSYWERSINAQEMLTILFKNKKIDSIDELISAVKKMPREQFRLTVNRVKGWNYIKSNNYSLSTNGSMLFFAGYGLGHNCGLSQKGSLILSERGYSRYEILEHYYPGIEFRNTGTSLIPCRLSYALFNCATGEITRTSNKNFIERLVVPGSVMKLVSAMYLSDRASLNTYHYTCTGRSTDARMPSHCWKTDGHGETDIGSALGSSCNLFFASLYRIINFDDFLLFYQNLSTAINITTPQPAASTDSEKCGIYTGLNFALTLSIRNIIDIYRMMQPESVFEGKALAMYTAISPENKLYFKNALTKTFQTGTAKLPVLKSGDPANYSPFYSSRELAGILQNPDECCGKTSSMIDGTNSPAGYGIFVGSKGNTGVIVLLKNGTGHHAAQWGKILLNTKDK